MPSHWPTNDSEKARDRGHILVGLAVAVANIDEVIKLIRAAPDAAAAREQLMGRAWPAKDVGPLVALIADPRHRLEDDGTIKLSEEQAKAILDLRLQRLTALGRDEIRTAPQDVGKLRDRLIQPLLGQIRAAQVIARFQIIGFEAQGLAEAGNRLGDFALARQRVAEVVVRGSVVGGKQERFLEVRNRLLQPSIGRQQVAQIVVGLGVIRVDSKRFEILLFGCRPVALFGQRQGKVVMTVFVFRVELHGLFVMRDGFINLPSSQQLGSAVQKIGGSIDVGLIRVVGCKDIGRYRRRAIYFLPDSAGAFGFWPAWKLLYDPVPAEIGPCAQNSQTDYHRRYQQPREPHRSGTLVRCGFPDGAFLSALHEAVGSVTHPRPVSIVRRSGVIAHKT